MAQPTSKRAKPLGPQAVVEIETPRRTIRFWVTQATLFNELHADAARVLGCNVNATKLVDDNGALWSPECLVMREVARGSGRVGDIARIRLCPLQDDEECDTAPSVSAFPKSTEEVEKSKRALRFDLFVHLLHLMILLLVKFVAEEGTEARHDVFKSMNSVFKTDELRRIGTGAETCDWLEGTLRLSLFPHGNVVGAISGYNMLQQGLVFEITEERLSSDACLGQYAMQGSCLENLVPGTDAFTTVKLRLDPIRFHSGALGNQSILLEEQYMQAVASMCGIGVTAPLLVNDSSWEGVSVMRELGVKFLVYNHNSHFYAEVSFNFISEGTGHIEADFGIHIFRFDLRGIYSHPAYYKYNQWTTIIFQELGAYLFVLQLLVLLWRTRQELKVARQSIRTYLSSPFHLLESTNLFLLYAVLAVRLFLLGFLFYHNYPDRIADLDKPGAFEPLEHHALTTIAGLYDSLDFLTAIALMFTSMTVFCYAESLLPRSSPFYLISATLGSCSTPLVCLTGFTLYWTAAMGLAITQFCGVYIARFATYFTAFATLCRMSAGDDDGLYKQLTTRMPIEYQWVAAMSWFLLQLSFILLVIPLYLSVLNHSYASVQDQTKKERDGYYQKMRERKLREDEAKRKHLTGRHGYSQIHSKVDFALKAKM